MRSSFLYARRTMGPDPRGQPFQVGFLLSAQAFSRQPILYGAHRIVNRTPWFSIGI
jgi:hypothetical protein